MPIAAILALTELIAHSKAGTMFELVSALNSGAQLLKQHTTNPISLSAGCDLLVAFVTTFPHESDVFIFFLLLSRYIHIFIYFHHLFNRIFLISNANSSVKVNFTPNKPLNLVPKLPLFF